MASAERAGVNGDAAFYTARAALREGLFGNAEEARQQATSALGLSTRQFVQCPAAWALALAGNSGRAQALADDLGKRYPENTVFHFVCLPTLQAQLALNRNDASKAIEALQAAAPTELGIADLFPPFLRGKAYLATHEGNEAVTEFQKILNHRGIVLNSPIGALARLQIGRALAMQGDTAKAKAAYRDFLTLWKDADSDIPILIAAKSEYARLH